VVEGPGAYASTGAQGCGSSTPTPAATPDFLIRAHRPRDGCGARRSHQTDRRPPFVRMEPAVSARALNHRPGAGDQRCTALPFLCSTFLARYCGDPVRRWTKPYHVLAGPVHVQRTCSHRAGPLHCPVLPYPASLPNRSGS